MITKRYRRPTPTNASLIAGWYEATSREIVEVKPDTASDFYLKAKGHIENKEIEKSKSE